MNIETIIFMLILLVASPLLFYMSDSPERMAWSKDPYDPVVMRLIVRATAWAMLLFVFLTASMVTLQFIYSLIS